MKHPEILAPAGSFEALEAAVNSGADAVYLGQKSFSARASAANFDGEELARAVSLCHRHGVKVHQAVNTVVFDEELPALKECVRTACEAGVDAFIVQDLGVAELLRRWAPDIPRHASTQMSITSLSGVGQAKRLGFSRAVLARELSLEEIRAIAAQTDLELEVFVHGALCMCVSGQCTLSAMIGSRSANRGGCAQPCRLPFSVDASGSADLSLKDLCALEQLSALAEAGVDSFKIEGRMKRPEYVGAAVRAVREKLEGGVPDVESLRSVFSRGGFTNGYLDARRDRDMFGVRSREDVTAAQGVLGKLAAQNRTVVPRVPLEMSLALVQGAPARLIASDLDENRVEVIGAEPEPAKTAPLTRERAEQLLGKLGGTPYYLSAFSFSADDGLMLPASAVNALRREAVAQLDEIRSKPVPRRFQESGVPAFTGCYPEGGASLRLRFAGFNQCMNTLGRLPDWQGTVYLPVDEVCAHRKELEPFAKRLVCELPRACFDEPSLCKKLDEVAQAGFSNVLCQNVGQFVLTGERGLRPSGGFGLNLTNSCAAGALAEMGARELIASYEMKFSQFSRLHAPVPLGLVAYGRLPLMVFRNCPVRARKGCKVCGGKSVLTDRLGNRFPLSCNGETAQLLNCKPVVLSDKYRDLATADFLLLYFTKETPDDCARVFEAYRTQSKLTGDFTRGLYYRGIE